MPPPPIGERSAEWHEIAGEQPAVIVPLPPVPVGFGHERGPVEHRRRARFQGTVEHDLGSIGILRGGELDRHRVVDAIGLRVAATGQLRPAGGRAADDAQASVAQRLVGRPVGELEHHARRCRQSGQRLCRLHASSVGRLQSQLPLRVDAGYGAGTASRGGQCPTRVEQRVGVMVGYQRHAANPQ